jgi:hypothetical protein
LYHTDSGCAREKIFFGSRGQYLEMLDAKGFSKSGGAENG